METDIAAAERAERDLDGVQRVIVLIGFGWLGLAVVLMVADYKIKMRRYRKRAEQAAQEKDRDEPPRR